MKKYLYSIVLTIISLAFMNAQTVVTIGTASSEKYIPIDPYYEYSYTQSIYPYSLINKTGNITKIVFKAKPGTSITNSNDWTVYMANTKKNNFTNTQDWIPLSKMTQVYKGIVSLVNNQVTIDLSANPFSFDGTNLLIAVDENKAGADGVSDIFLSSITNSGGALASASDNGNIDPASPPANADYKYNYLPNIDLHINEVAVACPSPKTLAVNNLLFNSADLSWVAGGTETSWNIEWGVKGFTQGQGTKVNGKNTTTHSISALSETTAYQFYVQADCGATDGTSNWAGPFEFTTPAKPCEAVTTINENFESTDMYKLPKCWSKILENASSQANVSVSTYYGAVSGTKSVSLYNANSPATANIMLVSPEISNLSAGTHRLRFQAKNSNPSQDIIVGTLSNPADGSTFTPIQNIDLNIDFAEFTVDFTGYTGTDKHIAIKRLSTSNYKFVIIDDIIWEVAPTPTCDAPTNLVANNITGLVTADLSWTANNSELQWAIEYGTTGFVTGAGTTINISANPYTLTGLNPNTTYDFYIKAKCSATNESLWSAKQTFTTPERVAAMVPGIGINTETPKIALEVNGAIKSLNRDSEGIIYECKADVIGSMGYDTKDDKVKVCTKDTNGVYSWKALRFE